MPSYWIKFYVEVLDDSKIATLPDRLWRRFFELCLIAGKEGRSGMLPDTPRLAWTLRMNTDDLALDLAQLASTGMVEQIQAGWLVCNFAKRQAPVPADERYKEFRKRNPQYAPPENKRNSNETQTNRLEINRLTDTEAEEESPAAPASPTPTPQNETPPPTNYGDASSQVLPILSRSCGLVALPPAENARIDQITSLIQHYGAAQVETALKRTFTRWTTTKRKNNGGTYRPTNLGWIDWAQDDLMKTNVMDDDIDPTTLHGEEFTKWLERQSQQQPKS